MDQSTAGVVSLAFRSGASSWGAAVASLIPRLRAADLTKEMRLDQITDRPWHVQPSCATTGEGLWPGLKWLAEHVKPL